MKKLLFVIISALVLVSCENGEISKGRRLYEMYFEKNLKDPQSFVVYEENFEIEDNVKVNWKLEYGARNGFGGMVREKVEFSTIDNVLIIDKHWYKLKDGELVMEY